MRKFLILLSIVLLSVLMFSCTKIKSTKLGESLIELYKAPEVASPVVAVSAPVSEIPSLEEVKEPTIDEEQVLKEEIPFVEEEPVVPSTEEEVIMVPSLEDIVFENTITKLEKLEDEDIVESMDFVSELYNNNGITLQGIFNQDNGTIVYSGTEGEDIKAYIDELATLYQVEGVNILNEIEDSTLSITYPDLSEEDIRVFWEELSQKLDNEKIEEEIPVIIEEIEESLDTDRTPITISSNGRDTREVEENVVEESIASTKVKEPIRFAASLDISASYGMKSKFNGRALLSFGLLFNDTHSLFLKAGLTLPSLDIPVMVEYRYNMGFAYSIIGLGYSFGTGSDNGKILIEAGVGKDFKIIENLFFNVDLKLGLPLGPDKNGNFGLDVEPRLALGLTYRF